MMKHGRYYLIRIPSLERIFNDIIETGTFPTEWNMGVIKPIYKKKGDKKCQASYRGITLTSCLGKLFTSILQNRLNKFIEQHNILNPEQFGFRPNARTTNSLFILLQLHHKYTKQHQKPVIGSLHLCKRNSQFENYLALITKPAHRISLTRLRLGCHALRTQIGKYENRGALIPVEERTCLVCKENCTEHEQHFLMYSQLHSHISNADTHYPSLSHNEKTRYLLTAENTITSKIIGKYIHLIFQRRKEILDSQM